MIYSQATSLSWKGIRVMSITQCFQKAVLLVLVFQLCAANDLSPIANAVGTYMDQGRLSKSRLMSNPNLPPISIRCVDKPLLGSREAACHFKSPKGTSLVHLKKGEQFHMTRRHSIDITIIITDVTVISTSDGDIVIVIVDITVIEINIQFRSARLTIRLERPRAIQTRAIPNKLSAPSAPSASNIE